MVHRECLRLREGGRNFIEDKEENTNVTRRSLSLSQLSIVKISLILDTPLKGQPKGVYIGPRMILVLLKLQ